MCGRYTLTTPADVVAQVFRLGAGAISEYSPRYNIAPTQMAPVIRVSHTTGERKVEMMRWGLIPFWSKGSEADVLGGAAKMINARSETVASNPAYRQLLERRRCLIPADAFYEWRKPQSSKERKQPFAIRLKDDRVFAFAGLWDRWKNEAGEKVDSYTILTTKPNEVAARYHDRMPVMLISPEQWDRWLDESIKDVEALRPLMLGGAPPDDQMRAYPVSPRVNSAVRANGEVNDDAGMLAEMPMPKQQTAEPGLFE